ncbi:hypothetical protein RA2_04468 [Roseovarius sp. A-2]|uniref:hypothetical protein n=1 Tax=Roseovarius sp. A-2 TaxID=1570360 RepID=UPI0009B5813B|nr:hypothetical protein [Roseovarius sp. A-2]GAW37385.1 hypothetical protein RA2_04468 [Roseovarius sp. A-2]
MRHIFFKHPPRAAVARLTCLGSHKALGILFPVEAEAMTWLKGPHRGGPGKGADIEPVRETGLVFAA